MRDAVDDLIWDEAPAEARAVAVLDAPALVDDALTLTDDVRVFCDDWRDAMATPPHLLVANPDDIRRMRERELQNDLNLVWKLSR